MHDSRNLLTTREAAMLINLSPRSLEGYRLRGGGPPFYRVGRRCVRYDVGDLLTWAKRQRLFSTSEAESDHPKTVAAPSARHAARLRTASSERT